MELHNGDHGPATVALLPWGNLMEDFLGSIGVTLDDFCRDCNSGWMFGYIDALQRAGVRPIVIGVSAQVHRPKRMIHRPTGVPIHILPALRSYRLLRRKMLKPAGPFGRNVRQAFGDLHGVRSLARPLLAILNEAVLYLTTPPRLLARVLLEEKCTALLCQEYEYPRFDVCVLLGRVLRVPVFATFQGGDYQRKRLERLTRPLAMRFCAGLVIATESEAKRVRARYGVPPQKIARVFNPVDRDMWAPGDRDAARARLGIPCSARVVAWHGRVSVWKKGLDILLDAWRRLRAACPTEDRRLILLGTGEDADRFRHDMAQSGADGILWVDRFLHDRATVRKYLAAADVYAFASRHEGFPVALIEAMACGLPVVAAAASGVADILEGGEASGGLIIPREDPDALARALERFLADPAWSRRMGERARRRVDTCFAPVSVGRQLRTFLSPAGPAQLCLERLP